jgi:hypothetical protein
VSDALGLSIGAANLVAVRAGGTPLTRRSVLTLFQHAAAKVGDPEPNSIGAGQVMRGFVERVGQSAPVLAADGTPHGAERLTAEALEAMARAVGDNAPVTVAVPAYWSADQSAALREALFAQPALTPPGGVPPVTIPDATAALAALHSEPGFPTDGVVTLCDFGASGTSVTLTDAASNFQQIGPTVRYGEFSGDRIDQLMLRNLQTGDLLAGDADGTGTSPMASLSRRFDECRRAKERLSAATVTVVPAPMPGFGQDARLSRGEFEDMISEPLDEFVAAVEDILQRNGIPRAKLAAAATVGGGACIPLITSRLSERLDVPIFTTSQPALSAAVGAAELGRQRFRPSVPTAPGPPLGAPGGQPTDVAPAGWAIQAASEAAGESAADDDRSATYRALAWSQDADGEADPIPYAGDDPGYEEGAPPAYAGERRRWYTRPGLLVAVTGAAAVALVAMVVAAVFKLTSIKSPAPAKVTSPVESSEVQENSELPSPSVPSPAPSEAPPPPTTVTTVTTVSTAPTTAWATTRPPETSTAQSTTPTRTTTTAPRTTAPTTTYPGPTYPETTQPRTPNTYPPAAPWPLTTSPPWGY